MADSSKTEKATPKKRNDERKKGNVFLSQDAVSVTTLIGASAALFMMGPAIAQEISDYIRYCFYQISNIETVIDIIPDLLLQGLRLILKTAFPLLLITAFCGVTATFAQTRLLVSTELMKPKFNRINPLQGFKRLFSLRSIIEALKGLLKISILGILIFSGLKAFIPESITYLHTDISSSCFHLFSESRGMLIKIVISFIAIAAADYLYQWWNFEKELRMSKQEIKEEYKQMEGDPQVKGKIKEIQRKRAQMRMMQSVPQSDVVIRNPTHFAVALRYHPETDNAPVVLAKGQDEVALRIVKIAEESKIPTIENVPLARALYAQTDINQEIPQELYGAVAEVLVYIFKLNEQKELVK